MECRKKELFKPVEWIDEERGIYASEYNGKRHRVMIKRKDEGLGKVHTVLSHNENLGVCYLENYDYITPNMPKLPYAFEFKFDGMNIILTKLNKYLEKRFSGATGIVFEKRDGFNLLFYPHPKTGEPIPKTRLKSVASIKIQRFIENEISDILEPVKNMLDDGYIPIFEVWGRKLNDYDIIYGGTDVSKVMELEGISKDPVAELLAVRKNDGCYYPFVNLEEFLRIADEYGLKTPKIVEEVEINDDAFDKLKAMAEDFDETNKKYGRPVFEGGVLHISKDGRYGMFKVKAIEVMKKDVLIASGVNSEVIMNRIQIEISKLLNDFNIDQMLFDEWPIVKSQLREYLEEDIRDERLLNKVYKIALYELGRVVRNEVLTMFPEYCKIIPEKYRELKGKYYLDKYQKRMINTIMAECRRKGLF